VTMTQKAAQFSRARVNRAALAAALGLKPGPKFGEILEAIETRQLEGALKDRQEALDWVRSEYL